MFQKLKIPSYIFLLTVLATLGNYFKYSLYQGLDLIFGSIFVMIIVIRYGTLWAVIASFVSSLVTYYHWNHPYAIVVFLIETLYVSTRYSKKPSNIAIHDLIFWSTLGLSIIPAYHLIIDVPLNITFSIYLKSAINGTFNALISSFIYHSHQYFLFRSGKPYAYISFKNLILELLVLMLIIPLIATIVFVFKSNVSNKEIAIKDELVEISNSTTLLMNEYISNNLQKLMVFSKLVSLYGSSELNKKDLEGFLMVNDYFRYISLIDNQLNIVLTSHKDKGVSKSYIPIDHNLLRYIRERYLNKPSELLFDKVKGTYSIGFLIKKEYSISEAYVLGLVSVDGFKSLLEKSLTKKDFTIHLLDNTGRVVASTNNNFQTGFNWKERNIYTLSTDVTVKQIIDYDKNGLKAVIWSKSYYTVEKALISDYGWRLIVDFPVYKMSNYIISEFNYVMLFVFVVMIVSILIANNINRLAVDPVNEIISETANIKEKVNSYIPITKRHYFIEDFNILLKNYIDAYNVILSYFVNLKDRNIKLEEELQSKIEELKKTAEDYKTLSDNMLDIIYRYRLRPTIKLEYINNSVERITGFAPIEFYTKPNFVLKITHLEDKVILKKHILGKLQNTSPTVIRIISNYGVVKWLELKDTLQYGEDGEVIGIEGIARDVTERNVLTALVNESFYQLKTIFDLAPDAIFMADAETGLILDANQSATRLLKAKKNEIIGKHYLTICPPEIAEYAKEKFLSHAQGKYEYFYIDVLRYDGVRVPVEVIATALELQNRKIQCGFFRDITDRKNHEEQMKRVIAEKETLIREVHHRVKNNMQVMLSLIDIQSALNQDEHTKTILFDLRNRIRAMSIVHEALYRVDVRGSLINIQKYIYDLIDGINNFYGKSNITIRRSVDNMSIRFEKAINIGLIINEMITNAFKYGFPNNQNGIIDVSLTVTADQSIQLLISDNGIGLPTNFDLPKDASLGLQLVNILVLQMNGKIDIKGEKGLSVNITFKD